MSAESPRPNPAISAIRYIVWALPLPMLIAALYLRARFPGSPSLENLLLLAGPLSLAGLALFDALLYCNEQRIPRDHPKARIATGVTMYIVFQLVFLGVLTMIGRWLAKLSSGF